MSAARSAALVAVLLLASARASAQTDWCLDCHDSSVSPLHADLACADCHLDVAEDGHPDDEVLLSGRELCASCHDLDEGLVEGAHATVECSDCHGAAHELTAVGDPTSPMAPLQQVRVCGACHDDPPELLASYLGSEHARALLVTGLVLAPSCSDCHGAHRIFAAEDPRSTISSSAVPAACGSCHQLILDTWRKGSAHGQAWLAGDEDSPTCVTCHASHAIMEPTSDEERRASPEGCGGCHEELLASFRDSFHGHATDLGFVTAAICSDCHTPHANLEASDPRSSVHADNLRATCGACHGEVPAAFLTFDPHSDPTDPQRNPNVHRIWVFMHGLLLAVIGFFLAHDALWLQRSAVGLLRGEHRPWFAEGGEWVRRFDRKGRRLHLIVVTTFLLLAVTGLPLRFHEAGWARALADLLGGVSVTGFLHRLAALATFGYFVFHLVDLTRRTWGGKERGLFLGWRSLTPRWQDLTDLWAHLRYFFYAGRRPEFDRWTYWEKFDYFAVFWGVLIIGASGLILWFPELATTVLPGWTLNAAYVIHSEEALLAVSFIFIFHFFHTHLRPGAFPMDTVIFLGSQPLARLREERPLEYRRLVESGMLSAALVEPPSRRRVRRAYIQGFLALSMGLLLAGAIVWTLLAD